MARSSSVQSLPIIITSPGDNTVIPAPASGGIQVYGMFLFVNGNTAITFKNGITPLSGPCTVFGPPQQPLVPIFFNIKEDPWFTVDAGNCFMIDNDAAVDIMGTVYFTSGG